MACLCPLAIQLLVQAAANTHLLCQIQFPQLWQTVSWQLIHNKYSRNIVSSYVRALAQRLYQNLTTRTTAYLAQDNPHLMVHLRHKSVKTLLVSFLHLSPSQVLARPSVFGLCNGSTTSLAQISSTFHSCSRLQNTSLDSGSGSSGSSQHSSHISLSSILLVFGCACVHSLIHGIGSALWSSIELILGYVLQLGSPLATGTMCLGNMSNVNGSKGALSNPESHMFGLPIVGNAGSLLPQYTRVHAHMLESNLGQSSASVLLLSSMVLATAAAVVIICVRLARGQIVLLEPRSSGYIYTVQLLYHLRENARGYNYSTYLFGLQGSQQGQQKELPSLLILSVHRL